MPSDLRCSTVLLRPLLRYLQAREGLPREFVAECEAACRVDRVTVAVALSLVERATELTQEPRLGLHAALSTELGDFAVLEWVATSARTWREANQTVCRYARVLNDAADYRQVVCGDKSHLMLGSAIPLSQVLVDYQLAAYHLAIRLRIPDVPKELEVWFRGAKPDYADDYRVIFQDAKLVFDAAFNGFVSDAWRLDLPLPTANEPLHEGLRAHAEHLLAEFGAGESFVQRVSADILRAMREGSLTAERTAARLGVQRRTLTRRLAAEGTSFSELLKEARYRTAAHYLRHTEQSVEVIAFLVGFSECGPFVRAFRRWSGQSPTEYRRSS